MRILSAFLAFLGLTACGAAATTGSSDSTVLPQPEASASVAQPGPAPTSEPVAPPASSCAGPAQRPPPALGLVDEPAPSFAIGAPGKGSLCKGDVYVVKQPVTVYRVFSSTYETSKKAKPAGAYWTLDRPSGSKDKYRTDYGICAEWNDLDKLNTCTVNVGAKVVIGPGQSAECENNVTYPQSPVEQVLIIREQDGKVPVSDCKETWMVWGP